MNVPQKAAEIDRELDAVAPLQAEVPDSLRRFIKAEAAIAGQTMGDWLTDLVIAKTTYAPPHLKGHEQQQPTAKAS